MTDPFTVLSAASAVSSMLNVDRATVQQWLSEEGNLSDFQEKLQTIRVEAGFSLSPSFTQPFEEPPAPYWKRGEYSGQDTQAVDTEEMREEVELPPEQKELIYVKFTQIGLLVSQRIDISIRFDEGFQILTDDEVPGDVNETTHYNDSICRITGRSCQNIVPGYEDLVGSTEWKWNPSFPPIRTVQEVKGKVTGNIFPVDSILVPIWIQTPEETDEYSVDTVANPQNPQIPLSRKNLTISVN